MYGGGIFNQTSTQPNALSQAQIQAEIDKQVQAKLAQDPKRPEFTSLIDPATGMLKEQYGMAGKYQNLLKDQLARQKTEGQESALLGAARSRALSAQELAMKGGLDSGARERLARNAGNQLAQNFQDARAGDIKSELQGTESLTKVQGFDLDRTLGEKKRQDDYALEMFKEEQRKAAAERSAQAMEQSSSGKK